MEPALDSLMRSYVWHPYTQMKEWPNFDVIVKGSGMWLHDSKGRILLDGVASMWCNVWGHSKKELVSSMVEQTKKLQHSSLFNLTNNRAEDLAEKLVKLAPNMHRVFYSDDGSTAMEISAKIALQYWYNKNEKKKTRFVALENGYHGDTIGAMSLGYVPSFFSRYKSVLFPVFRTPSPNSYRIPDGFIPRVSRFLPRQNRKEAFKKQRHSCFYYGKWGTSSRRCNNLSYWLSEKNKQVMQKI